MPIPLPANLLRNKYETRVWQIHSPPNTCSILPGLSLQARDNMSTSKTFSILGKNLKANTKSELEPYLSELESLDDVEEVHFGGNSLGVEACQAIAEVLRTKTKLKVCN